MVHDRIGLLDDVAEAVAAAWSKVTDRGLSGLRDGQYSLDLATDAAALNVLARAGVGVLSEESGLRLVDGSDQVVIIDPVDGSTNASRGVPWFATSLCLVEQGEAVAALVVNLASGDRFTAERGGGAWFDGQRLGGSGCTSIGDAIVGLNGLPSHHYGWAQARMLGASALDLCLVAAGTLDGYVDCVVDAHGVWDYAAATLICAEAGVPVVDAHGRDLIHLDPSARRTPVAGATRALLDQLVAARNDHR